MKVTQTARDAAAALIELAPPVDNPDIIRHGGADDAAFVQAFATFERDTIARLAATPVQNRGEDFQRGYEACREDAARYIEGHGGVIPGATVFIPLITGDNMPCMSGDGRDKLHPHKRRYFDDATRTLATAIRNMEARNG